MYIKDTFLYLEGQQLRSYFNCNGFSVILKSFLNTEGRSAKFKGILVIMQPNLFT